MAIFQDYHTKRKKLLSQMVTIKELEKDDEIIGLVLNISRNILEENQMNNVDWLLKKGMELVQYGGALDRKYVEQWGGYKVAEIAFKSVRDALMLASKGDHKNVTSAKAAATRATQEAEVDAIAREQKAKLYERASEFCKNTVMFIQTTLRWKEQELKSSKISERGNKRAYNN